MHHVECERKTKPLEICHRSLPFLTGDLSQELENTAQFHRVFGETGQAELKCDHAEANMRTILKIQKLGFTMLNQTLTLTLFRLIFIFSLRMLARIQGRAGFNLNLRNSFATSQN